MWQPCYLFIFLTSFQEINPLRNDKVEGLSILKNYSIIPLTKIFPSWWVEMGSVKKTTRAII